MRNRIFQYRSEDIVGVSFVAVSIEMIGHKQCSLRMLQWTLASSLCPQSAVCVSCVQFVSISSEPTQAMLSK